MKVSYRSTICLKMSHQESSSEYLAASSGSSSNANRAEVSGTGSAGGMLSNERLRRVEQATPFGKKSFLDPHLSVLELLERAYESPRNVEGEEKSKTQVAAHTTNMDNSTSSISESWQAIQRNDNYISVIPERCSSQATAAGILSSSDTSEEELDVIHSPTIGDSQQKQQQLRSLSEFRSISLNVPLFIPELESATTKHDDGDDETITKSLASSSNSFVMPKLSLSQKTQKFRILILGRPGLKFYQSIPKRYQHMFEVSHFQDPSDFKQFTGILVVFQELKEMVSLLSRICHSSASRPIIPVCQTGQLQQVKNLLSSMTKSKLISLLYPPVVVSNHLDLNGMYKFLQDLSKTLSDNSDYDDDESDAQNEIPRKSSSRKKRRLNATGKHHKGDKEVEKSERLNKWVIWGISLTVGVGIGYFMSYCVSSTWISVTGKSISPINNCATADNLLVFEDSSLELGDHRSDADYPFSHVLGIFKQTLKHWNGVIKQFFNRNLSLVEELNYFNRNDWTEENTNRILALGYILL